MTDKKRKYCMETIIPGLRKNGVTLTQIEEELEYREQNNISEAREGLDIDLYYYSTGELGDVEELWCETS